MTSIDNVLKPRSAGVTTVGWLLILYPILAILYPIVASILVSIFNPALIEKIVNQQGPVGGTMLLQAVGVSSVAIIGIQMAGILALLVSICSFIGGIMILKLKNSSRKFIIIAFSVDFLSRIFLLAIAFTNVRAKSIIFNGFSGFISTIVIVILEILLLVYLTRVNVKQQFH